MKKHLAVILIILGLGIFSWAQAPKEPFDSKKSQTEMEIMKGILSTTLSHAAQDQPKNAPRLDASDINSYYLVGQGAVFVIPTSQLRRRNPGYFQDEDWAPFVDVDLQGIEEWVEQSDEFMREANEHAEEAIKRASDAAIRSYRETRQGVGSGVGQGVGSGVGQGTGIQATPMPPAPPAPPAPPSAPQLNRAEIQKKAEAYREKLKKSREAAEADRKKFLDSLSELQTPLVEALANYGDSLTTVKPGEYINLILMTDHMSMNFGNATTRHDLISAQKSWISDYKAGKLSLEDFKRKVLQYIE